MSQVGVIPTRLRPLIPVIVEQYTVGLLTQREISKLHHTNTAAISAILIAQGLSRHHGSTRKLRRRRTKEQLRGNRAPAPKKSKDGKLMETTRILCSAAHLAKPKLCLLHDYPKSCSKCKVQNTAAASYQSCMNGEE